MIHPDLHSWAERELLEKVAGCRIPPLSLDRLKEFTPFDWTDLAAQIGQEKALALCAAVELVRRTGTPDD